MKHNVKIMSSVTLVSISQINEIKQLSCFQWWWVTTSIQFNLAVLCSSLCSTSWLWLPLRIRQLALDDVTFLLRPWSVLFKFSKFLFFLSDSRWLLTAVNHSELFWSAKFPSTLAVNHCSDDVTNSLGDLEKFSCKVFMQSWVFPSSILYRFGWLSRRL